MAMDDDEGDAPVQHTDEDDDEQRPGKARRLASVEAAWADVEMVTELQEEIHKYLKELNMLDALKADVGEIYSPPRVCLEAPQHGLRAAWSPDLTTTDELGNPWDFNKPDMRNKAARKVIGERPLFVIGSPMCTDFSSIMNFNWKRMGPEQVKTRLGNPMMHLKFACYLHRVQVDNARYLIHEHPLGASSWRQECIETIMCLPGVIRTSSHMCAVWNDFQRQQRGRAGPEGHGIHDKLSLCGTRAEPAVLQRNKRQRATRACGARGRQSQEGSHLPTRAVSSNLPRDC